jgi:hypothetical protein
MLAVIGIVGHTQGGQKWWAGLSSAQKLVFEATVCELSGIGLIWVRVRARELRPKGIVDWKEFVFEIALVLGGVVALIQASRAR